MNLDQAVSEIRYHEEEARKSARGAVAHKIAIGQRLQSAKGELKGGFLRWAEDNFGWKRAHIARHLLLAKHKDKVLNAIGADASMRAALAACITRDTSPGKWLVVGFLDAAPEPGANAAELVSTCKDWRIRKG